MYEDDDDFIEEFENDLERKKKFTKAKTEFISGCYQAYDMLITKGPKALEEAEISSIKSAINRMAAFFISQEEYERCNFLKKFVSENMKGFSINPDKNVYKELEGL